MTNELKGVVLDVDGTLVDSNDAHAMAWVEAFAHFGFEVPFQRVRDLIGMGGDKMLPECTGGLEKDSPLGKEMSEWRAAHFKKAYLPKLRPFPGVRALLERFARDGLELVVASSAQADELGPLLERAGVADLIEAKTSSSDAERSKPDPDIVQAALRRSGLKPSEAVMVGDTPYDVEASTKAGVRAVAFRCGGWDDAALAGATAVYDGAADLLANYEGSVFGGR